MEKQTTEKRVTNCIYQRAIELFKNDGKSNEKEANKAAHNFALALDFIGAGKIITGEAYSLLLRCMNNEFENETELLEYIEQVKRERKPREYSEETKRARLVKKLKALGLNDEQIERALDNGIVE